jgi:ABC-type dipeptide/oligopeptide/nickel transport system ATPase component
LKREAESGIYVIEGGMIPLQIIITKRLKKGENIWLKHLSNDLNVESMSEVMKASQKPWKSGYIRAYMHMLFQANGKALKEVMKMRSNVLEKILEEEGWTARWEKRGETRGRKIGKAEGKKIGSIKGKEEKAIEIARKLLTKG